MRMGVKAGGGGGRRWAGADGRRAAAGAGGGARRGAGPGPPGGRGGRPAQGPGAAARARGDRARSEAKIWWKAYHPSVVSGGWARCRSAGVSVVLASVIVDQR